MSQTLTITALSNGEAGIARCEDGKVAFIPHTAPGDVVEAKTVKETASYRTMELVRVAQPGSTRVAPACPLSDVCGGCPWMQVDYETQLKAKRANVVDQLSRIAGFGDVRAEELVAPALGSKRELGYRNKLELNARMGKNGRFELGFHAHSSHDLVSPKTCPAATRSAQKLPSALRGALSYLSNTQDLGIYRVGVRSSLRTKDLEVALWTPPSGWPRKMVASTVQSACRATSVVRVMANPGKERAIKGVEMLAGKGRWTERLADIDFEVSAPSFFQVNTAQAERMIELVKEGLSINDTSVVADLYCGVGTFALPLAREAEWVFAVESAASSVRDLRRNADANGIELEVIGGDSARELPELGHLDALVVDPPRAGLAKGVAESIAAAGPERMAYVSCNPATWARDIARLEAVGYALQKATPMDLFPQTHHIETVSLLARTSAMHPYIGVSIDVSELDGFKKKPAGAKPMRKSENT